MGDDESLISVNFRLCYEVRCVAPGGREELSCSSAEDECSGSDQNDSGDYQRDPHVDGRLVVCRRSLNCRRRRARRGCSGRLNISRGGIRR